MEIKKKFGYRKPNGKTGGQYSLTIPAKVIADMGITEEEREVLFIYDEEKKMIILKKAQ